MKMAKWLLLAVLALPFLELGAFVAVAKVIGFGWALLLLLATSLAGSVVLRYIGGRHITQIRGALSQGNLSSFHANNTGGLILLGGFLLLIPGFITDLAGLLLLLAPIRQWLVASFGLRKSHHRRADDVVDLEPEQWHRVSDPALSAKSEKKKHPR